MQCIDLIDVSCANNITLQDKAKRRCVCVCVLTEISNMKLNPSVIAANLSAAAAAEASANSNSAQGGKLVSGGSVGRATVTNAGTNVAGANTGILNSGVGGSAGGGGGGGSSVTSSGNTIGSIPPTSSTSSSSSVAITATNNFTGNTPAGSMGPTTNSPGKNVPKDSQVVNAILQEMNITDFDPRVVPQLTEFAYRFASRVLEDAQLYSSFAKKKTIDCDDVNLAVMMLGERSFMGPPSRNLLMEIARNKNSQPLPAIKSHNGMRLPADRYSLVAANVRLASNSTSSTNKLTSSIKGAPRQSTSLLSKQNSISSTGSTESSSTKRRLEYSNI